MFKIHSNERQLVKVIATGQILSTSSVEFREWLLLGNTPEPQDNNYVELRVAAYPNITDQLDSIYHNIDEWKSAIQSVKDQYPKSTETLPLPDWVETIREELANPKPRNPLDLP
jgi:hypothetical protein